MRIFTILPFIFSLLSNFPSVISPKGKPAKDAASPGAASDDWEKEILAGLNQNYHKLEDINLSGHGKIVKVTVQADGNVYIRGGADNGGGGKLRAFAYKANTYPGGNDFTVREIEEYSKKHYKIFAKFIDNPNTPGEVAVLIGIELLSRVMEGDENIHFGMILDLPKNVNTDVMCGVGRFEKCGDFRVENIAGKYQSYMTIAGDITLKNVSGDDVDAQLYRGHLMVRNARNTSTDDTEWVFNNAGVSHLINFEGKIKLKGHGAKWVAENLSGHLTTETSELFLILRGASTKLEVSSTAKETEVNNFIEVQVKSVSEYLRVKTPKAKVLLRLPNNKQKFNLDIAGGGKIEGQTEVAKKLSGIKFTENTSTKLKGSTNGGGGAEIKIEGMEVNLMVEEE